MSTYNNQSMFFFQKPDKYYSQDFVRQIRYEKDGYEILTLYEELLIETLNKDGVLAKVFGEELVPYTIEELSKIFTHKKRIVEKGLELFKKLNIIEEKSDGTLFFPHALIYTQRTTVGAGKKKVQRNKQKEKVDKCPRYIEQEKEIENNILTAQLEQNKTEECLNKNNNRDQFSELLDEYENE